MEPEIKAVAEEIKGIVANVQAESKATKQETVDQKAKFEKMETKFSELNDKYVELEAKNAELSLLQNQLQNTDGEQKENQEKLIKAEQKCFSEFLVKGSGDESYYKYMTYSDSGRELKELRTDVQEFGGYLVGTQFGGILESNRSELGTLAQECNGITLGGGVNSIKYPLDDDDIIQPTSIGEGAGTSTTTTETLSNINLEVHDLMRKVKMTTSMIDDGVINIEQWLASKVSRGFGLKEEQQILSGIGANEAKGILTYTADASSSFGAYTRNRIQFVSSGAGADIASPTGLDSLLELLKADYMKNAKLYMHSTTAFRLLKLLDTDNRPLLDPDYTKNPGINMSFRGFPISLQQAMPVIAADDFPIVFGDLKEAYTVVRKKGFRIVKDIYTSDNNIIVKTTERFGGAVTNFEALKIMKVSA